jgi:4-amino-4-deoxy-L-arabinose transferase-like glycosyltransferase
MKTIRSHPFLSDLSLLILLAVGRLLLHTFTNHQYGFHRDELAVLDDAHYLAWGYVAYPPVTPFIVRVSLALFGESLVGLRFFSALAQSVVMVLAGLMARDLGGGRWAQVLAALTVAITPMSLLSGAMFQYVSFDYLWWVVIAFCVVRLLKTEEPRWWLAIGTAVGLGLMTKYTVAFFIAGLVVGILLTPARRYLKSPWLWGGVALALLICLPNLIWQIQHNFISLEFLSSIHARDVAIGRTEGFLLEQFLVCTSPITAPLWIAGLYYYFFTADGQRYRTLGYMYVVPLVLLWLADGRSYYLAPAYPMLLAAGAVFWEGKLAAFSARGARLGWGITWGLLLIGALVSGALTLPLAPVNSAVWEINSQVHDNFVEQIGWPELVATVAQIYQAQPDAEKPQVGILAGNYGEAGAINWYGRSHHLPQAISGINSYHLRGYGRPAPQILIVVGFSREGVDRFFETCELAGHITNRYHVPNEETTFHPDIFLCRNLRQPWPELWRELQSFG